MANLVTSPEILPLIEPVLSDSEIVSIKNTSKILEYRIESDNRSLDRERVETILTKNSITFGELTRNVGGFGGSEIDTYDMKRVRLIYKLKGNRGSGGGAEATKLTESAQCLYAAIAFGLNRKITASDITTTNARSFSGKFKVDETTERILSELPDEWVASSLLGANKLYERFNKGDYVIEKFRMDINKWNPSDIWMIRKDFNFDDLTKEKTILGLNQVIQEKLEDEILIGVSLKKMVNRASITAKNIFKDMKSCKFYAGYEYSIKSIDAYVLLTGGTKIQYRSFGAGDGLTGFQGEVKGAQANQGKISLGPTNMILRNHGVTEIPTNAANRVRKEPLLVFKEISAGLKKYGKASMLQIKMIGNDPKMFTPKFLYSKLQATQLLDILERLKPKTRNQIVEDLYLYASSQSKYSSAYYKLE
jgi:hypothetical protein